jgi:hypothetical protein
MAQTFELPLAASGPGQIRFPDRCIACGAPAEAESPLTISRLVMRRRRQVPLDLRYTVPHCARCHRATRAIFLASMIPFLAGFLLIGGAAFLLTTFSAGALDRPGVDNGSIIAGAAAGLALGVAGGALFEQLARLLLLPLYGAALRRAPPLISQLLRDTDYVAGIELGFDARNQVVRFMIEHDDLAQEFGTLNSAATPARR